MSLSEIQVRVYFVCGLPQVNVDQHAVMGVIKALMRAGYDRPGIYPTLEGHVLLEWLDGLSLEVSTP